MKNKLPNNLTILQRHIKIERKPLLETQQVWGLACPFGQTIEIDSGMPAIGEAHVLLHEIFHVYDDVLGIGLRHNALDALAHSVLDLVQNNPELIRYLQKAKDAN